MLENRAGYYKNNLTGEMRYKSFVPTPLPVKIEIDDKMAFLLAKAGRSISALETLSNKIPNKTLFTAMYIRKETLLSSQIEGTQATFDDILDPMVETNSNRDVEDVVNYVNAVKYAIKRLKELPLCNRLLRETHSILMKGVRGKDKNPGEFRHSQNWIGASLSRAHYIPPCPEDMIQAMSDLEKYINDGQDETDVLIRAALIHYQIETIHPFLDGNGRLGRLLIMLFLIDQKVLTTPAIYVSYFLKKYQSEYYARLSDVRNKGYYEQWIMFFLNAINESAQDALQTIEELDVLHTKNQIEVKKLGRAGINTLRIFEYLQAHPIINISKTSLDLGISFSTVSKAVKRLVDLKILIPTRNTARNRIFAYQDYIDILKRDT